MDVARSYVDILPEFVELDAEIVSRPQESRLLMIADKNADYQFG